MVGDIRLGITAQNAKSEVKDLTDKFKELNYQMNEAAKNKDWASFNSLASAMNNLENYKRNIINESRGVPSSNLPMQNPVGNFFNGGTNLVNTVGNGLAAAGSGSVSGVIGAGSSFAQSAAKGLSALGVGAGATAAILGAAGLAFAGGAAAQKVSKIWEDQMDSAIDSNAFYNTNRFNMSAAENSQYLRNRFDIASQIRKGTRYSSQEVLDLQNEMARYGYDANSSIKDSQAIINAQANTNASRDALSKLAGLSNLYGFDGAMSIQNAYQGLKNSGMTDARFDEFLNSVTQAMEDGVSKGFVGSVEDIVNNQSLFAKLSGNDVLWTGKNGADRLNKIGNGFASAVNLNSTTDMMMYGAALGITQGLSDKDILGITGGINDPTIAARIIMEQGSKGGYFTKLMGNFAQNVDAQFGNMPEYELQTYMKSFGLNVTGATQLMALMNNWKESGYSTSFDIATKAGNIINANENKSNETNYVSAINDIKDKVATMGQNVFELKNYFVQDVDAMGSGPMPIPVTEAAAAAMGAVVGSEEEGKKVVEKLLEASGYNPGFQELLESNPSIDRTMILNDKSYSYSERASAFAGSEMGEWVGRQLEDVNGIYNSDIYKNSQKKDAKDEFDNILASLAIEAGEKGHLKGQEINGKIDSNEMWAVYKAASNNENVKKAYESNDRTAYIEAIKQMLIELFGQVNFTTYPDSSDR